MWQKTEKRQSLWQTHNTECTGLSHCWEGRRSMRRTNCETRRRRTKQNKKLEGVSREERLVYLFLNHRHHPPQPHTCLSLYVTESWSCWGGEAGEWGNGCDSAYLSTKVTSACVCTAVLTQSQLGCSAYQSSLCHIQHLFWLHTAARWSGR